jgi:hypothetical protein
MPFDYATTDIDTKVLGGALVESIEFDDGDGGRASAYLVGPANPPDRPLPGVVYAHGGGATNVRFLGEAIEFAGKGGVAVLPHNDIVLDGDPEVDLELVHAGVVIERRALDVLSADLRVDASRLGYVGHSWGASMGAMLSGIEPRLKVVILAATGARLAGFFWRWGPGNADEEDYVAAVSAVDPVAHVGTVADRGVLYQLGTRDSIPLEDTQYFWAAIAGDKELREYDCDHNLVDHVPARADRLAYLADRLGL